MLRHRNCLSPLVTIVYMMVREICWFTKCRIIIWILLTNFRELERHYLSQIKALKGELSQEKEQQVSLTQEIDHKKRYFSLQLSEQENRLKEDLCQLQIVSNLSIDFRGT